MSGIKNRIWSVLHKKGGESLVGVLAAFVVMLLILGMYAGCVQVANNLNTRARLRAEAASAFVEWFYTGGDGGKRTKEPGALKLTEKDGSINDTINLSGMAVYAYSDENFTMYSIEEAKP